MKSSNYLLLTQLHEKSFGRYYTTDLMLDIDSIESISYTENRITLIYTKTGRTYKVAECYRTVVEDIKNVIGRPQ